MQKTLKPILAIQELDMQMIQLMRLKREKQADLDNLHAVQTDLLQKAETRKEEIVTLKAHSRLHEIEIAELVEKMKKLELAQGSIKRVEEFNALSHEMAQTHKEKVASENKLSDLIDRINAEEDLLKQIQQTVESTKANSLAIEADILQSIDRINQEGRQLKAQRDHLTQSVDPETFRIYERLLKNKRDRVIVPIENRCCSGCHIMLTAQDENLVRKGERLVFCEHCSRIHYWVEKEGPREEVITVKAPRRRSPKSVA